MIYDNRIYTVPFDFIHLHLVLFSMNLSNTKTNFLHILNFDNICNPQKYVSVDESLLSRGPIVTQDETNETKSLNNVFFKTNDDKITTLYR